MDKLQVCEGGVGSHRWMTKRKEQKKDDGREARSAAEKEALMDAVENNHQTRKRKMVD